MPTPHPINADRQAARVALAALPPATRAFLEALHAEHFPPRADGGMAYRLEDLLCHLAEGDRHGFGDERLARALAVPVAYLRAVREAVGQAAGGGVEHKGCG
jgi:hypothetical protein